MLLLGIDIGGTKCGVTLARFDNEQITFLDKISFPTNKPPQEILDTLINEARQMLVRNNTTADEVTAAGINCGGPLDSKRGVILCPPNLPGWVNIPAVEIFERALGIKCYLQNDAKAGAIAEFYFGAGRGFDNIMFLTFGTGMGCGMILNGQLYCGTNDMGGEVGHIRLDKNGPVGFGKAGSFEGFCSGGGIAQLAKSKITERWQVGQTVSFCQNQEQFDTMSAQVVAQAAKEGDALAKEIFAICGTYLGSALSLFIDILNPQRIILGTIYEKAQELLEPYIMEVVHRETIPFSRDVVKIVPCGLGGQINDYEAVSIALYETKKRRS